MQDQRLGSAVRAVRMRRRWRQADVATRAHVSRSLVSMIEHGHLDRLSLAVLRRVGAALDIRVDAVPRWRGGELDRLLNARHSAMHELFARRLREIGGWQMAPEVSFSVYGERGAIDVLAWHPETHSLLVVELKTAIVDVQELVGTMDRKMRLANQVARKRGWLAATTSGWVVVAAGSTNRRRIADHRTMLRAAFPDDGRAMLGWLQRPVGALAALSMWSDVNRGGTGAGQAPSQRVAGPRTGRT